MYKQWKVLHLDEIEEENILFCRALTKVGFAGDCESARSIRRGKSYLERALLAPQSLSRPDIIVINWHPDCDKRVLDFVSWVRSQPQLRNTPIIVFITDQLPLATQDVARQKGVTEMVVRPANYEELVSQVKELLERCRTRCVTRIQTVQD